MSADHALRSSISARVVAADGADPVGGAARRAAIRTAALGWFDVHGRPLNFRRTRDPYSVLVSEVIAQQTQIARVEPAWQAFIDRFPTVASLAEASTADVLRQWQGLGYNRRALNLQRSAQAVMTDWGGTFPADVAALARLPGVGPYTARAVAAIAFGLPAGAVDTNVRRVLGRVVLGEAEAVAGPALQRVADELVPTDRAGAWTHALMDVGALFCRPTTPRCEACPMAAVCRFRRAGAADVVARGRAPRRIDGATNGSNRGGGGGLPRPAFRDTTRWLRGRLVDRARATADGKWFGFEGPLGSHPADAVGRAARALAAEGLLELHPATPGLARLPRSAT